jgi:hypothetical protein
MTAPFCRFIFSAKRSTGYQAVGKTNIAKNDKKTQEAVQRTFGIDDNGRERRFFLLLLCISGLSLLPDGAE